MAHAGICIKQFLPIFSLKKLFFGAMIFAPLHEPNAAPGSKTGAHQELLPKKEKLTIHQGNQIDLN